MIKIVEKETPLLEYLYEIYPSKSKKEVKNILSYGHVTINHKIQTQYNYILHIGDKVEITQNKKRIEIDILYEDNDLIVINKPSGLLSMASDKEKMKTAYHKVREYLRQKNPQMKVFIVHRLDQDTSGVLIFAKNETIKNQLQNSWNDLVKLRSYIAIVEGSVSCSNQTISSYLKENKTKMVYSSTNKKDGKLAITHYQLLSKSKYYSMLQVKLDTGRKNQIRVHMHDIGHPIIGDKKYGATSNPIQRLGLHSQRVEVVHPVTSKLLCFEAPIPDEFIYLMERRRK